MERALFTWPSCALSPGIQPSSLSSTNSGNVRRARRGSQLVPLQVDECQSSPSRYVRRLRESPTAPWLLDAPYCPICEIRVTATHSRQNTPLCVDSRAPFLRFWTFFVLDSSQLSVLPCGVLERRRHPPGERLWVDHGCGNIVHVSIVLAHGQGIAYEEIEN